ENGDWSVWSQWSQCSVTCGKGTWERRRVCDNPAPICGGVCLGDEKELSVCDTQQVCPTHGEWGSWKPWNECSSSCIQEGSGLLVSQSRHRECNSPSPSTNPSGRPCPGLSWEQRNCASLPFCPVDGEWGEWQKDSGCSVTCGIGRVKEKRICNNPASRHGGRDCVGSPTGQSICKTEALCPIDGQWSEWQDWDRCSRLDDSSLPCTRRVGLQNRKRECERRRNDGNLCAGPYRDSRRCYNIDNCNCMYFICDIPVYLHLCMYIFIYILHRHTLFEQIPSMYLADTWNAPLLTSDKPRCVCLPSLGSCLADGRLIC
ncbi:hypothetical protein FKM82_028335, partial [Ascaphus truei]